jgi:hypothetical protein
MGIGTSFPGGFQEFMQEIESGGVGAMEMVSRDMKALGMYLSGSISFGICPQSGKAVEYRERIHRLTPQQHEMYDRAAAAWQTVLRNIGAALEVTNGGPRARAVALNKFWGDHQRFFRQVICNVKLHISYLMLSTQLCGVRLPLPVKQRGILFSTSHY